MTRTQSLATLLCCAGLAFGRAAEAQRQRYILPPIIESGSVADAEDAFRADPERLPDYQLQQSHFTPLMAAADAG
jgi:hypothetical protein